MASPFADRTNVASSPFEEVTAPLCSPVPPPPTKDDITAPMPPSPPPVEAFAEAPATKSKLETVLAQVPASQSVLGGLLAGHAAIFTLYIADASPVSITSWLVVVALIANGIKTTVAPSRVEHAPLSASVVMPYIESAINTGLNLVERFRAGEPKLTFGTAIGAWSLAVVSSHISMSSLMWLSYAAVTVVCALKAADTRGQLQTLAPHVEAFRTKLIDLVTNVQMPPAAADLLAGVRTHAPTLIAYSPLAVFFAWGFLLTLPNKLLSLGLGVLGYRAWASPDQVDSLVAKMPSKETIDKVKKGARRMTMGAGDLVRMASGAKAKEA